MNLNVISRFNSSYITKYYDYFEENGTGYIVLKYYEGETLDNYIKRTKIPLAQFLKEIYLPILEGWMRFIEKVISIVI